jgi:four helix bundle protein
VGAFRDLAVYRRSVELSDALFACVARWDSFARWTVGLQMVRSADSVGANIAEAAGRESNADQRRFLIVARASSLELQHWLDRASERGLPIPTEAERDAHEIGRMVNGLVKTRT